MPQMFTESRFLVPHIRSCTLCLGETDYKRMLDFMVLNFQKLRERDLQE